jgi:hypothetical protein
MEKTCEVCGVVFEAERVSARFCAPVCRKLAFLKGRVSVPDSVPKVSVPGVSVPESDLSVLSVPDLKLIDPNDQKVIEEGQNIADEKKREMVSTVLPSVSLDEPCRTVETQKIGEVFFDLVKDLHLDMKKDLGIFAWTKDGIFIRPDITIQQTRNIRRLVEAKHGWPHRVYDDETPAPYSTAKLAPMGAGV